MLKRLLPIIDWFIPDALRGDLAMLRRVRFFVFSHLLPPLLSLSLIVYSYWLLPQLSNCVRPILAAGIGLFFAFPFLLKLGARFDVLALASTQWFALLIIYAAFNYGGASSPFLAWFAALPVSGMFYIGMQRAALRDLLLGMILLNFLGFYLSYQLGFSLPQDYPPEALRDVGLWSDLAVAAYVASMVMGSLGVVAAQQEELEREVTMRRATEVDLLRAKDDAERAIRTKSVFLANTSHELRTPLNAIIGFSELLDSGVAGEISEKQKEYVGFIHDSGTHLLSIIMDILDLAKVESGKFELNKDRVNPQDIVKSGLILIKERAHNHGLKLIVNVADNLPWIIVDPVRFKQVLINLLTNAVKFTPKGGRITLGVHATPDGGMNFVVADTGVGIPKDKISLAMEPFMQIDGGLARQREGTGLGLPLSDKLMRMHGGQLIIESEENHGTVVTMHLPAACMAYAPKQIALAS